MLFLFGVHQFEFSAVNSHVLPCNY